MSSEVPETEGILGYITKGVYIVTTKAGDSINGQTVAWVTQASLKPSMISVVLYEKNYTTELILKSGIFAVNILKEGQEELALHFGTKSGRNVNKFKDIDFQNDETGSPILNDCLAYLDCEVSLSKKAGDHIIFVGEVVDQGIISRGKPLIYKHEDYF